MCSTRPFLHVGTPTIYQNLWFTLNYITVLVLYFLIFISKAGGNNTCMLCQMLFKMNSLIEGITTIIALERL